MASAEKRSGIVRDALGIGIASGAYAISFGAISTTAGLSLLQTVALSLLMFTGASQFALVGVLGAGGSVWAGAATAALLGTRNALYGVRLSSLLGVHGPRLVLAAQFVIDETTARRSRGTRRPNHGSPSGSRASRCSRYGTLARWPARSPLMPYPTPRPWAWMPPRRPLSSRCSLPGCASVSRWPSRWAPGWWRWSWS